MPSSTTPRLDELTLFIEGAEFRGWSEIDVTLALDTYSSVELTAPFEPKNKRFREIFRPFTFKPLEVRLKSGESIFTGTLVGVDPSSDEDSNQVHVSAYSLPAVLEDCMEPASALPIEFKKLGLRAIAEAVAKPFGIEVEFRAPEGTPFKKVKLDVDKEVNEFLIQLAQQRNLVLSSTPEGKLLCWRSVAPGAPVASLIEGEPPVTKVSAEFSPQDYFSEITGYAKSRKRKRGSKYTEKNPWLPRILRPHSFKLDDTDKGDAPEETRARMGRMFANMAAFTVELATWRDPQVELYKPNTTVLLTAPGAMVYSRHELLIRTVTLHDDKETQSASLGLVLPGSFSAEIPKELPWQE